jgi:hypothetical protein
MAKAHKLELDDNELLQKMEWRVQRIGWLVWTLIIIAALAGLLGPGMLSSSESSAADNSLTVAYDRFAHYHHPTSLELTVRPNAAAGRDLRVKVSQSWLDRVQIHRIAPEPEGRQLEEEGVIFTFPRSEALETGKIVFHIEFEQMGTSRGRIEVIGQEAATFNQFVYP